MKKKPRRAIRYVGGVKFVSGGDGHYYSEDGRFGIFHMMRWDKVNASWEVQRLNKDGKLDSWIYDSMTLGEIIIHAARKDFKLE